MPIHRFPYMPANPTLLLIEVISLGYPERATQLSESQFHVTQADDLQDLDLMRNIPFTHVVLSDTIGTLALRFCTRAVRKHWPKARTVILGRVPRNFQPDLYDDYVPRAASGHALLATLLGVSNDPLKRREDTCVPWIERVCSIPQPRITTTISESDPRKASTHRTDVEALQIQSARGQELRWSRW